MPIYEVKAWVMVEAPDEARAKIRACELLDRLGSPLRRFTSVDEDVPEEYDVFDPEDYDLIDAWPWREAEGER